MHNIHSKRLEPGPTPSQTPSSAIPTSGLGGRAIPKSALEPKAAGAVTLTWPMYLPVVEVGGRIMSGQPAPLRLAMTPVLTATKMCLQWWRPRFVGASVKNALAYCDLLREFGIDDAAMFHGRWRSCFCRNT